VRAAREKPNEWVTVADLMAGVVAIVILLFVIAALRIAEASARVKSGRLQDISTILKGIDKTLHESPDTAQLGAVVTDDVVDLGNLAQFDKDVSTFLHHDDPDKLRSIVRRILPELQKPPGPQWIKQVAVVGYASVEGTYLHNLDLTLARGERVL
jgi:outer membrane protein OmpA-like peptidoglycan-associated protein